MRETDSILTLNLVALQSFLGGYGGGLTTPPTLSTAPTLSIYDTPSTSTARVNHAPGHGLAEHSWRDIYNRPSKTLHVTPSATDIVVVDVQTANTQAEELDMKQAKTKATIGVLATLISYVSINSYLRSTQPDLFVWRPEDREEDEWTATSKYWLDRKACRWLGLCGVPHLRFVQKTFGHRPLKAEEQGSPKGQDYDWQNAWNDGRNRPEDWTDDERVLREIPDYVMEHAPLVHLFSGEQFWPCDIAEHLFHVTPELNYTPIYPETRHPSLNDLDKFNEYSRGRWVFLTSNDNVEERPEWLEGQKNIPSAPTKPDDDFADNDGWIHHPGKTYIDGVKDSLRDLKEWFAPKLDGADLGDDFQQSVSAQAPGKQNGSFRHRYHQELRRSISDPAKKQLRGGRSDAPAVLITVNKGNGVVDAFWFFFYSFNLGNVVFNIRFGNHVGDWEHTAIRFHHGVPKAVFFSEHDFGSVYSYEAVEKIGKRPVIYSATGTHAMYATPGLHPYVLPWGILHDQTDRGPLWDPVLNSHTFTYDPNNDTIRASQLTPNSPTGFFHYAGRWGDKFYPLGDRRQYRFAGQYHYVNGPLGPKFKDLDRPKICAGPPDRPCVIKHWLGGSDNLRMAPDIDRDEKPDQDSDL